MIRENAKWAEKAPTLAKTARMGHPTSKTKKPQADC
jgi:hypothetical protein